MSDKPKYGNHDEEICAAMAKRTEPSWLESEHILSDDYPVYWDYLYVADGKVISSPIKGDVWELKRALGATEIRNCDFVTRAITMAKRGLK